MDRVVLDTDVSSLSLKHRLPSRVLTRLVGKQPRITFVTLGEVTQSAELRQWGRRNRDALENWLGGVIILPAPPRRYRPRQAVKEGYRAECKPLVVPETLKRPTIPAYQPTDLQNTRRGWRSNPRPLTPSHGQGVRGSPAGSRSPAQISCAVASRPGGVCGRWLPHWLPFGSGRS